MAIKPILFNTEMVRAILDGRKTCTRRKIDKDISNRFDVDVDGTVVAYIDQATGDRQNAESMCKYQQKDILYVRETWSHPIIPSDENKYVYRAGEIAEDGFKNDAHIWHPSIHMPKGAARIWLKVTDIRVERLQDITSEQICREGTEVEEPFVLNGEEKRYAFSVLWDFTIKKSDLDRYGWNANPWVWVIEFERCEKPKEVQE